MTQDSNTGRTEADRRKAIIDPDSILQSQLYFDVERGQTVVVSKGEGWGVLGPDGDDRTWEVHDARSDEFFGAITHRAKKARMRIGGRYINLDDVPDEVRQKTTKMGLCPACQRETATDDPEREMTVFASPDGSEGWAECDQGRGHRYPVTEVLFRVEQ